MSPADPQRPDDRPPVALSRVAERPLRPHRLGGVVERVLAIMGAALVVGVLVGVVWGASDGSYARAIGVSLAWCAGAGAVLGVLVASLGDLPDDPRR